MTEVNQEAQVVDSPDSSEDTCALFVGNIAYEVEEEGLRNLFSQFVTVHAVRIIANDHRRFAFVDIIGKDNADKVIEELNSFELAGRPLIVKVSVPRTESRGEGQQSPKWNNRFEGGKNYYGRIRPQFGNNYNINNYGPNQNGWFVPPPQQRNFNYGNNFFSTQ